MDYIILVFTSLITGVSVGLFIPLIFSLLEERKRLRKSMNE